MAGPRRVAVVVGSLRKESLNRKMAKALAAMAPPTLSLEIVEIGQLPLYNQDDDANPPPASVAFKEKIAGADAVLFVTPEYNRSVPGVLKNAIDWASRPVRESALTNKTVSVIGASPGQFGAMWAQQDLRRILGIAGARVVGDELPVPRVHEKFDHDGRPTDAELSELLRVVLETLAAAAAPVAV